MKTFFSVVIPTYNEENNIKLLLEKLIQLYDSKLLEIIIIDSSSCDNTLSVVKEYKNSFENLIIYSIKKNEFNHGLTRNIGARLAKYNFVCFFSADVLPLSKNFFLNYIEDFKIDPRVVAVFGKNIPYPNTPILERIESDCRWDRLDRFVNKKGVLIQMLKNPFTPLIKESEMLWFFLSNTSSCYKKSFLLKYPFPKTEYGEDILMGKQIINNNYYKIYDKRCAVMHSNRSHFLDFIKKERLSLKLRIKNLRFKEKINIFCKIKKICSLDICFFKKILYLFMLFFYYFIKILFFLEIKLIQN